MDCSKIYGALIERSRNRTLTGYSERHHVVPRCMGGGDEETNIVRLTPEEHLVAHELLVRIYDRHPKVIFAMMAMMMNNRGLRKGNKGFGWARRLIAEAIRQTKTGVPRHPSTVAKVNASNRGKVRSPEHVARMSAARKGIPHSPEHNAKVGRKGRISPMKGRQHSEETKAKQRAAALKRRHSEETKAKLTEFAAALTPEQRSAKAYKAWQTKRAKLAHD